MADELADLADRLDQIAARVEKIDHFARTDPERIHAEKSDIAARLRRHARSLRGDRRRSASTTWRGAGFRGPGA